MFIYAISSSAEPDHGVVYVGSTVATVQDRLKQHLYNATHGAETRLAQWLRQQPKGSVVATEIDHLHFGAGSTALHSLETDWVRFARASGRVLLNGPVPLKTRIGDGLPPRLLAPPRELPEGLIL